MKTTVVNLKREEFDVYIGRKTARHPFGPWGNPFVIGPDGNREQVIEKFAEALRTSQDPRFDFMRRFIHQLQGQRLGCYCKPLPCHGDVLAKMADES